MQRKQAQQLQATPPVSALPLVPQQGLPPNPLPLSPSSVDKSASAASRLEVGRMQESPAQTVLGGFKDMFDRPAAGGQQSATTALPDAPSTSPLGASAGDLIPSQPSSSTTGMGVFEGISGSHPLASPGSDTSAPPGTKSASVSATTPLAMASSLNQKKIRQSEGQAQATRPKGPQSGQAPKQETPPSASKMEIDKKNARVTLMVKQRVTLANISCIDIIADKGLDFSTSPFNISLLIDIHRAAQAFCRWGMHAFSTWDMVFFCIYGAEVCDP